MRPLGQRSVAFKKWQPETREWTYMDGFFNAWGIETIEGDAYTVAIIEGHDGQIYTAAPENVRFTDR